jgi:multiple sugar transport system ATP-binding protein
MVGNGSTSVSLGPAAIAIPEMRSGASGKLVLGVRPENVHLDDAAALRGAVTAVEYLGTTQIITLATAHGPIKARVESRQRVKPGEMTGLRLDPRAITLFDASTGQALISAANQRVLSHG